ncbi:gamma-glutamyl-gamma-aminobutyrate hydrolase family protein [Streptococcus caprae]|uniref:Gamma-glutamyl-gamma-aminobutyrate hydrolase family protein n=1 Tax=Streptococcus caprae TaxID=1640501 RepID=A0ABV8CT37_9STRE
MAKVKIGISGNIKEMPADSGWIYDAVPRGLSDCVKEAGGLPIVIPVSDPALAKDYVEMIDKLILSGGQNVDPSFYGEEKSIDSDDYHLERDEFELALIREALKQHKPIFAVCRGMQLVNVALGGTLNQAVTKHWQSYEDLTSHSLEVKPDSTVSRFFKDGNSVNSYHRQSVKDLAPGLEVTARDPRDGTIEAVEGKDGHAIIGFQWHPEFLIGHCEQHRSFFQYLVNQF